MKHTVLNIAALAVVASLTLAGCRKDEPATPEPMPAPTTSTAPTAIPPLTPDPNPAPAAQSVMLQAVTVGSAVGADNSVAAKPVIGPREPIIVSVRTSGSASNTQLAAILTYQDGQVAGEQEVTLQASGEHTTNITFNNSNAWPTGDYTAKVSIADGQATEHKFQVR